MDYFRDPNLLQNSTDLTDNSLYKCTTLRSDYSSLIMHPEYPIRTTRNPSFINSHQSVSKAVS